MMAVHVLLITQCLYLCPTRMEAHVARGYDFPAIFSSPLASDDFFDELPTCKALCDQLKFSFGGTSTMRLRSLVIKFEEYTKDPKHTMNGHLRVMSDMIGVRRLPPDSSGKQTYLHGKQQLQGGARVGSYQLKLRTGCTFLLEDMRYAPIVRLNLFIVTALLDNDFSSNFRNNKLDIFLDDVMFGHGFCMDSLFQLDLIDSQSSYSYVMNDNIVHNYATWHARLGHIGQDIMTRLDIEGLLSPLAKVNLQTYEACLAGKACRKPFEKAVRATQSFELVHSDICGPMGVKARHGASYFLTLMDDYTRYGYVYMISHRYEALDCFKRFVAKVENEKEKSLKTLCTG
ncbi:hypothetical protein RJ640_008935 [Escallonia rubra]|uniref:GAG-pre-integrase domain-containing protein n=1 Tax=Escallonia rubra TaxID=112253 RepID=A0AA88S1X3_9ASTE|nr:hypothetical protein RJ640_008935 [Escallonia rubra]